MHRMQATRRCCLARRLSRRACARSSAAKLATLCFGWPDNTLGSIHESCTETHIRSCTTAVSRHGNPDGRRVLVLRLESKTRATTRSNASRPSSYDRHVVNMNNKYLPHVLLFQRICKPDGRVLTDRSAIEGEMQGTQAHRILEAQQAGSSIEAWMVHGCASCKLGAHSCGCCICCR